MNRQPEQRGSDAVVDESLATLAHHGRSFRFASVFLSPQMRADAAVAYAFCRLVDDAVDEANSVSEARRQLEHIEAMLEGRLEPDELTRAYVELTRRLGIGLLPARDLIAGARSDLSRVRIQSDQELSQYCYRVAGTVGLMMCGILGVEDPRARQHAIQLGMAMQLTNISRDVAQDALMDRVYLPEKRLRDQNITPDQLTQAPVELERSSKGGAAAEGGLENRLSRVVCQLLLAAEVTYTAAAEGFQFIPPRPRLAIMVASSLYQAIGHRLIRVQGANPLRGRTVVPLWEKLLITARTSLRWLGTVIGRHPSAKTPPPLLASSPD
jgi:phytoene synthase